MDIQELKNSIAVIETGLKNIERLKDFQNRQIAIIPTESEYWRTFQEWVKINRIRYGEKEESPPMYVPAVKTNKLLELLIKAQEDFIRPHKDKIKPLIDLH